MAFETIDAGTQSGIAGGQPQAFKIETESEWADFWARHQAIVTPQPALPAVDFSREMVIAVVDRQESSGGFGFEITDVVPSWDTLAVVAKRTVPGQGCIVTAALTQPFHIVRTAKSGLPLELVVTQETYNCG